MPRLPCNPNLNMQTRYFPHPPGNFSCVAYAYKAIACLSKPFRVP